MHNRILLAYITDVHGDLDVLRRSVSFFSGEKLFVDYLVLGGDISGSYVDYLRLEDRHESFEEWKENTLREALAILGGFPRRSFAILGNDDLESYNDILDRDHIVDNLTYRIQYLDNGEHFLVGFPYVPPTPFMTRFELEEKELERKMKELLERVPDHGKGVWVFHAPPHDSGLDEASRVINGRMVSEKVGSKAVRTAIKRYEPKLFLCGHIHESRSTTWIGKTLCINPGSANRSLPFAVHIDLKDLEYSMIPLRNHQQSALRSE